jgi:cytochrome c oxidase subunit II
VSDVPTSQERPRAGERPGAEINIGQMVAVGLVASAAGIGLSFAINWFPVAASTQAGPIDTLWHVLLVVSVPIFVLVTTIVGFAMWKFRMRPGEEELDGPNIHGNTKLEVIWTAIPAIILVGLCGYAYAVLTDIESAQASEMKVRVVGEQFAWTFYYPDETGKEVASNQLYLPVNRSVEFTIQSKDVLHDFWVPAFRVKKDAVPGIDTDYRVQPTKIGTFPVVCAELCGLGHSVMRSTVHVVSNQDFEAFMDRTRAAANQQASASTRVQTGAPLPGSRSGETVFTADDTKCGACHTLAAAGTNATIGPDLDKALRGKSAAQIRHEIVDPDAQPTDGYTRGIMPPNYGEVLPRADIDAVSRYLAKVTK